MRLFCQIIDKKMADSFVVRQFNSQLLQSSNWSDFQNVTGKKSWHLGVLNNEHIVATALVLEQNIFGGLTYLYCPRGPIVDDTLSQAEKNEIIKLLLGQLREITIGTKNKDEVYAKLEPTFISPVIEEVCQKSTDVQPSNTLLINLHQTLDQLVESFHTKTRYNIKLAQKHNVKVIIANREDFEKVWPLFSQTSERSHFRLHEKNYYLQMLEHLPTAQLWLAQHNGENIACAITAHFGDTITYLHGASNHEFRSLMAPYLLHWHIIADAKKRGFRWYDLHGIAPKNKPLHSLANVTRFKLGFGGTRVTHPGTYDLIYSPGLYNGYNLLRKIVRRLRKLF